MKKILYAAGLLMLAPGLLMAQFSTTGSVTSTVTNTVGIGTGSPLNKLHVFSSTNYDGISVDGNNPAVTLRNNGTLMGYAPGLVTTTNYHFPGAAAGDIAFRTNSGRFLFGTTGNNATMSISNGRIAIGNLTNTLLNPAYPLTVSSYVASGFGYLSAMYTNNYMALSEYGFGLENLGYGGHSYRFLAAADGSTIGAGNFVIADATAGFPRFAIGPTGNVGIGNIAPQSRLHVTGSGNNVDGGNTAAILPEGLTIEAKTGSRSATIGAQLEFAIPANTDGTNMYSQARIITVAGNGSSNDATGKMILGTRRMFDKLGTGAQWYYGNDLVIDGSGKIGVNTADTKGYQFAVNGSAIATSVTVKTNATWPDYVFDKEYMLAPLAEVKVFIEKNHHLPDMPAAAEVEKNGLDLGKINEALTKKVEELTLYLLVKEKQRLEQEKRLNKLEEQVKALTLAIKN
jgi:hypothetical protein